MNFGKRLKELRLERNMSQQSLADIIGVHKTSISLWERGKRTPELETFESIADYFNVNMDYLKGKSDIKSTKLGKELDVLFKEAGINYNYTVSINIYGKVPAGVPLEAVEDIIGQEDIPEEWLNGGRNYIALRVSGDSMFPKYIDGDIIIIKLQENCESGQDAVVYIDGYNATLKTVIKQNDGLIRLQPANPEYTPKVFTPDNIKILGVVKRLKRDFDI